MIDDLAPKPWERQPSETRRAFYAFTLYRDLGPLRSGAKVREQLGISLRQVEKWSALNNWVERSNAYDAYNDELRRERYREELWQAKDNHARIARSFLSKVAARLIELGPDELTPALIVQWAKVAQEMELRALGDIPVSRYEHSGLGGGPISLDTGLEQFYDILSDPKARELWDALAERLESQPCGDGG